jgi:hypothetical protein
MSDSSTVSQSLIERNQTNGRFLPGNRGNGGRRPGSRNRFAGQVVDDVYADWQQYGPEALRRVRRENPAAYLQFVSRLLPQEAIVTSLSVRATVNPADFVGTFRAAVAALGNASPDELE